MNEDQKIERIVALYDVLKRAIKSQQAWANKDINTPQLGGYTINTKPVTWPQFVEHHRDISSRTVMRIKTSMANIMVEMLEALVDDDTPCDCCGSITGVRYRQLDDLGLGIRSLNLCDHCYNGEGGSDE